MEDTLPATAACLGKTSVSFEVFSLELARYI